MVNVIYQHVQLFVLCVHHGVNVKNVWMVIIWNHLPSNASHVLRRAINVIRMTFARHALNHAHYLVIYVFTVVILGNVLTLIMMEAVIDVILDILRKIQIVMHVQNEW